MRLAQNPRETTRHLSQKGGLAQRILATQKRSRVSVQARRLERGPVLLSLLLRNTRRAGAFRGLESLSRRTRDPSQQRSISTRSRPGNLALRSILSPRDTLFPSGLLYTR